jgi:small subunit ribosomal protein S17
MKTLTGQVTKLAQNKTASVTVTRRWMHPLYKKYVKRTKKYACHVEDLKLAVGNDVLIQECRPMSKTKRFKVIKVLNQEKA